MPSALMLAPQRSMNNLSDMRGSPLKKQESLRGVIYMAVDFLVRQPQKTVAQSLGKEHSKYCKALMLRFNPQSLGAAVSAACQIAFLVCRVLHSLLRARNIAEVPGHARSG
ncbi:hypothetical protein [Bradyrhizobium sp. LTSPM299]|uniref:hypothetical protein n=1 Tax=Bradyrhizobium sp. LTSPM299 TaxID=1619233 RepID=UPI0012E294BA|nr:hypothetical protein [Bradyrhizobium sp. LTSPM299]